MKKVLLVYPVSRSADTMEHLGLGYVAAALRRVDYTVSMFVYYTNRGDEELFKRIESFQPDVVGFTTFTESLKAVLDSSQKIKELQKDVIVVYGGHAAVYSAEALLKDWSFIDYISVGDGEVSFVKLMKYLNHDIERNDLEGIICRNDLGEIESYDIISDCSGFKELIPARDIYEQLDPKPVISLLSTSRGCLGHCAFCGFSGHRIKGIDIWRGREPEQSVDEIEYLVNTYHMNTFFITDPTFEDPGKRGKERAKKFAEEILKRGLKINFEVHIRAENWHDEDMPLLKLLFKAGLESVVVGIESGSDAMLDVYDKIARVEDNVRIVRLLKEAHVSLEYGFIMFNPYTTYEDCYKNIKYFRKTCLGHNIKCILTKLEVYPGVGIERKLREDGLLGENYTYLNSMYNYKYVDERIKVIADALCELPERFSCIDELDIVNARIRIFMARLWRKFGDGELHDNVKELNQQVDTIAKEMMESNTQMVEKCLELGNHWSDEEFEKIVQEYVADFIPKKVAELKKLEFEFIFMMKKHKMNVSELQL